MELVSIIVPIYRTEAYLARCVDSILAQTYRSLQIILVDDGSPDHSGDLCDAYQKKDARIQVVHKENGGLGSARNAGLERCCGTYVTFVDSDDWIGSEHICNLVKGIAANDADICFAGFTLTYSSGKTLPPSRWERDFLHQGTDAIRQRLILPLIGSMPEEREDVPIQASVCTNLYRFALIQEHGLKFGSEKEAIEEDVFFNLRYLTLCRTATGIQECSYFYFTNSESITRKYDPLRLERTLKYRSIMRDEIAAIFPEEYRKEALLRADRSFLTKIRLILTLICETKQRLREKLGLYHSILAQNDVADTLARYPVSACQQDKKVILRLMRAQQSIPLFCLLWCKTTIDRLPWIHRFLRKIRGLH